MCAETAFLTKIQNQQHKNKFALLGKLCFSWYHRKLCNAEIRLCVINQIIIIINAYH